MVDDRVLRELRDSVEGDLAFVSDLVDAYVVDSGGLLDAIEAAISAGDADALVRPAHTLKSSSATLGAVTLADTARTLEMAGRSGDLDDDETRSAAARVRDEWVQATAGMRAWLGGEATG